MRLPIISWRLNFYAPFLRGTIIVEDLNALKEEIQITWEELGDKSSASDSLHLINEELRRLGEEVS